MPNTEVTRSFKAKLPAGSFKKEAHNLAVRLKTHDSDDELGHCVPVHDGVEIQKSEEAVRALDHDERIQRDGRGSVLRRPYFPPARSDASEGVARQVGEVVPIALEIMLRCHVDACVEFANRPIAQEVALAKRCRETRRRGLGRISSEVRRVYRRWRVREGQKSDHIGVNTRQPLRWHKEVQRPVGGGGDVRDERQEHPAARVDSLKGCNNVALAGGFGFDESVPLCLGCCVWSTATIEGTHATWDDGLGAVTDPYARAKPLDASGKGAASGDHQRGVLEACSVER